MLGTGKYRTMEEQNAAIDASGCEIITVAIRRLNLDDPNEKTILDYIDWDRYQILPNTAGARTAEEAIFTARLARALPIPGSHWIKVEVQPDPRHYERPTQGPDQFRRAPADPIGAGGTSTHRDLPV